ncbi:hypothetical protein ILUMI_13349 [Ignelater luminosus]|uniref:SH3 domain-containing protein n=1 Tax=Ignelater luminosus TaxID=2038154 RepID=A0A8K0CSG0_IGNLU|nr:hypothetical protein ILUMI_13349 [Ignelater luminosus]
MYRNKLNEQQNQRLNQQREALTARQEEMSSIDKRISELQERLHRKRLLNQQLATQISAASNKAAYHQLVRLTGSSDQSNQFYGRKPSQQTNQNHNGLSRGNIATVEPYNHVPLPNSHQIKMHHTGNQENPTYHPVYQQNLHIINTKSDSDQQNAQEQPNAQDNKISNHFGVRPEENDVLKEFSVSKSDPKYQTLPYNTKFTVSLIPNKVNNRINETNDNNVNNSETKDIEPIQHISNNGNTNIQSQHMTVHSAPLNVINKNIATPLNQNDLISRKNTEHIMKEQNLNAIHNYNNNNNNQNHINGDLKQHSITKLQSNDLNTNLPLNTSNNSNSPSYQKPVSSVAPTSIHHSGKLSNIYQTSSIKVQPVEPQTISNNHKQLPAIPPNVQSSPQLALSPPQANSTPVGTPETQSDKLRPALPPKPAIKPPPRQTQASSEEDHSMPPPVPLTEPPDDGKSVVNQFSGNNHRNIPQPPVYTQNKPSAFNQITLNQKNNTNSQQGGVAAPQNQTNNSQITSINHQNAIQPSNINHPVENMPIIKAKPLTIKKQPLSEQPKLRNVNSISKLNGLISNNRRIEIPSAFNFAETNTSEKSSDANTDQEAIKEKHVDETDKVATSEDNDNKEKENFKEEFKHVNDSAIRRCKKGNLKQTGKANLSRRVSFDPLALLLDASLEGELELVKKTAGQVPNPSAANDEGITALHNAICAGHFEIVKFLVEFGCDVNAQDSDGWTPLHCAASCNNVAMVKFLVEHGACIFATTLSDHETAAEKCEEDEEGFDGCSEYLYSVQEKLGILSGGAVYAVFDYTAQQPDELSFSAGQQLTVLRKGDESEREWWWSRLDDKEGYVPRNLLGLYPRVSPHED